MAREEFELRISFPRLLVGLLVTVIPISVAGLYTIAQSDRSLERTIGAHFQTIAETTSTEVAAFVHDRLADIGFLAMQPAVVEEVVRGNQNWRGVSEAAIGDRLKQVEASWTTPASQTTVDRILASPASRLLRRFREHDPRILRITVTDERGAFVAGTHKSLDYYQADEDFWQAIYAQGRGHVNITDIRYDELTKAYYIGIGVPVLEDSTDRFLGALDALVDVSSLFPIVTRFQLGATGRVLIVKDDGTLIAGPNANLAMGLKAEEYAALQDRLGNVLGRRGSYIVSDLKRGNRAVIAYADTGLKEDYGNLGWAVVVAQDTDEALAPVHSVGRLLAFMSLLGLAAVTILAVYFALHRARPLTEIETLAHEYPKVAKAAKVE